MHFSHVYLIVTVLKISCNKLYCSAWQLVQPTALKTRLNRNFLPIERLPKWSSQRCINSFLLSQSKNYEKEFSDSAEVVVVNGRVKVPPPTISQQTDDEVVNGFSDSTEKRRGNDALVNQKTTEEMAESLEHLQLENERLRKTLRKLEKENELLLCKESKIVLETFEGEGKLRALHQQQYAVDDFVSKNHPKSDDKQIINFINEETDSSKGYYERPFSELNADALWCDELEDGVCPVEPTVNFNEALRDRALWLVGLLFLQSASGIILARNEALLVDHPIIIYFLTMLVGAGGNAGNQASVRVIRGLALGTLNEQTQIQFLLREFKMAVSLCAILSLAGFLRTFVFSTPLAETVAITSSLAVIVFSSVCLGAVLPLCLKQIGVDPAHSSTTIQVVMDILGVLLAVVVSQFILDSPLGQTLVLRLVSA